MLLQILATSSEGHNNVFWVEKNGTEFTVSTVPQNSKTACMYRCTEWQIFF